MKCHKKWFTVLVALAIFTSGCTGDSEASPVPTSEPTPDIRSSDPDPTPTDVVEPVPTEATEPRIADEDLVAAAVAALDADVESGDGPADLFAYDLLDSAVSDSGLVTLTICGWTGDTVFDGVYDSQWRTEVDTAGAVSASHLTTPVAPGECLNTQLINSALETANQYDAYWQDVIAEPSTFATDERRTLLTAGFGEISEDLIAGWVEQDVSFLTSRAPGPLVEGLAADILLARWTGNGVERIELIFCRDMNAAYGIYRDGVLLDDFRAEADPGLHSVDAFQLVRVADGNGAWEVAGSHSLVWSDCFATGDWPAAAAIWRGTGQSYEPLDA